MQSIRHTRRTTASRPRDSADCSTRAPRQSMLRAHSLLACDDAGAAADSLLCAFVLRFCRCYMNSMLQALFLLPKFREVVYQMPSDAEDRGAKIGFALQKVFHALQTGTKGVSTKQLTGSFGWGSIDRSAHESETRVAASEYGEPSRAEPSR